MSDIQNVNEGMKQLNSNKLSVLRAQYIETLILLNH